MSADSSVTPEAGPSRLFPNILITGTPGTGKTTHAALLAEEYPSSSSPAAAAGSGKLGEAGKLRHLGVGEFVKEKGCHEGWDEEWESWIVDEDKLLDELEPVMSHPQGGVILDWHACDLFPERWLDLVVVLTCPHTTLWDRLEKRNYPLKKIQENNDCEIMETVLNEARESYEEGKVVVLESGGQGGEGMQQVEENVRRMVQWIEQWRQDNAVDGA